jgi:hypothetical protein
MTAVPTLNGEHDVSRTPQGIVLGPHGVVDSEFWLLGDEAAAELVRLLEPLENGTPAAELGSVDAVAAVGPVRLRVVLTGAAVELRDDRRLGVLRWTLRMTDQVEALCEALEQVQSEDVAAAAPPVVDVEEDVDLAELRESARSSVPAKHSTPVVAGRRRLR